MVLLYGFCADLCLLIIFSEDTSTKVIYSDWKIKLILKNLHQQLRMFYLYNFICV